MASISPGMRLYILFLLTLSLVHASQSILKSPLINEYARQSNSSLLWGPYRSNLYFGVRPRIPKSLLSGIIWYNSDTYEGIQNIRHTCEQHDDMAGYGWVEYDPRVGGKQIINDNANFVNLTTEFVKTDEGSWAVRIKGKPQNEQRRTTMVFYTGLEGKGSLDLESELTPEGIAGDVVLKGHSPELDKFKIQITAGPKSNRHPTTSHPADLIRPAKNSHYASLHIPDDNVWLAKEIFQTFAQDNVNQFAVLFGESDMIPPWSVFTLQNRDDMKGNVHLIQKTFQGSFEFDILYNPVSVEKELKITSKRLPDLLETSLLEIDEKFKSAFQFNAPFDTPEYEAFAKDMFSNLLGGISYFHGTSIVDRSLTDFDEYEDNFWEAEEEALKAGSGKEEGPFELFTAVPSRPFFPRGFYWDEGFHLIPILDYDPDLTLEILKSWLALVDEDGWIAREQILGPEARSKVPAEFQTQYPHYANPPTLMLLFSSIAKRAHEWSQTDSSNSKSALGLSIGNTHIQYPDLLFSYAEEIYPELQLHYEWFRRTQQGEIRDWDRQCFSSKEGYRWRGRTPNHCLTSGLDDYPRAPIPHIGELHVDLLSWIGMMTRSIKDIAIVLNKTEDIETYSKIEHAIIKNLDDLHWNKEKEMYCDLTINNNDESVPVCHKGYVSLFPFLLKLIPADSTNILSIINDIYDPKELWSPYGIRSLSRSDQHFGTKENYWRGPIWINMNYMVLESLQHYSKETTNPQVKELASKVYAELRTNVVNNVYENWLTTSFAWEQYNPATGKAQGVKHFLGWTSLVVKIMAMPQKI